jgi:hypothetical protein
MIKVKCLPLVTVLILYRAMFTEYANPSTIGIGMHTYARYGHTPTHLTQQDKVGKLVS